MWYGRDPLGFVPSSFLAPDAQEEAGGVVQYYVTQLEQRTDEAEVGEETTCYHLLGRGSQAFAYPTAHSFFILGLQSEIINLQEKGHYSASHADPSTLPFNTTGFVHTLVSRMVMASSLRT